MFDYVFLLICVVEYIIEEGFFCVVLLVDIGNVFIEWVRVMGWYL